VFSSAGTRRNGTGGDDTVCAEETEPHARARQLLGRHGQRYTRARQDLVELLAIADRPLTATELCGRDGTALSSLYRNLRMFEAAGVVVGLRTDRQERFELADGAGGHHHHHLICEECGLVTDYEPPLSLEAAMDEALPALAARLGFTLHRHMLDLVDLYGLLGRRAMTTVPVLPAVQSFLAPRTP
jgi:Fur family zinc uptake transcriptional regulator